MDAGQFIYAGATRMWRLDGRTILVTGASGGIGGQTVRRLIQAGAKVIASGRSKQALTARGGDWM